MPGLYSAAPGEVFPIRLEGVDSIIAEGDASTQFGRFFLEPAGSFRLPSVPTYGVTPTQLSTPAFTDSSLVGLRVGLQALTRSTAAPAGGAYSQPLLVQIAP